VGQRYRTSGSLRFRNINRQEQRETRERGKTAGRLDETKRTGNRQTDNTGISTQGRMGEMTPGGQGQVKQIRA
jgi:hypothetical protein